MISNKLPAYFSLENKYIPVKIREKMEQSNNEDLSESVSVSEVEEITTETDSGVTSNVSTSTFQQKRNFTGDIDQREAAEQEDGESGKIALAMGGCNITTKNGPNFCKNIVTKSAATVETTQFSADENPLPKNGTHNNNKNNNNNNNNISSNSDDSFSGEKRSGAAEFVRSNECNRQMSQMNPSILTPETKSDGTIKLNISNLSSLKHKVTTSFHTIANLPWRLAAKTECSKRTSNIKFFSVYIDCNPESESTLWSCDALVEFRLIQQKSENGYFARNFTNKFNYNSNNWGFPSFVEWPEILSPDRGYIKGDRVTVVALITVQKTRGVRVNPVFDFTCPQEHLCDGVLVVDGVRLHISKTYLGLYSPVFHALFFGEFRERSMNEIPVEDVILDEFMELLHVIYPSHKAITAENVEFLLELGDKFEMQFVVDECETFLTRCEEIAIVTKLVWADQYCLARLQDVCVRTFKTIGDIRNLKSTEEYKNLSDATKAALLEKIFKLM